MKSGLATIALRRYDIFYAIDLAAQAGFEGVEIWGRPPHMPDEFDEEHTRRMKDRLRGNGLKVSMFGSYANPASPDYEQRSEDALKIAKILGARVIRVWAGNKEPREADEEQWEHVARSFHDFALRAEDDGITLAIEMHSGSLSATPEGAIRVIEDSKAPNLKLNYQVSDPRNPDLDRVIGMVGDLVVNVHAQNHRPSCREPDKIELCLIREGLVDYDKVLSLLAEHGFKRYVEVEFLKGERESEDAMLDSLKKDAEYLKALTAKHTQVSPQC